MTRADFSIWTIWPAPEMISVLTRSPSALAWAAGMTRSASPQMTTAGLFRSCKVERRHEPLAALVGEACRDLFQRSVDAVKTLIFQKIVHHLPTDEPRVGEELLENRFQFAL